MDLPYFRKISDEKAAAPKDKHSFRLFINCPKCKGEANYWCHVTCSTTTYIDDEGFVFCEKSKKNNGCLKVFIQNARFNCARKEHGIEYSNFESLGDFLLAMGTAVSSIENSTYDMSKLQGFIQRLTRNIQKHWKFC